MWKLICPILQLLKEGKAKQAFFSVCATFDTVVAVALEDDVVISVDTCFLMLSMFCASQFSISWSSSSGKSSRMFSDEVGTSSLYVDGYCALVISFNAQGCSMALTVPSGSARC